MYFQLANYHNSFILSVATRTNGVLTDWQCASGTYMVSSIITGCTLTIAIVHEQENHYLTKSNKIKFWKPLESIDTIDSYNGHR